jgi:hypothetical protein
MPNIDTASFYAPMNASISRARRLAEEKGMRDDAYTNQMRSGELADADQARQLRQRMFDESGRQFDTKTNMFREMLARKMPDFFGGGMGGQPQAGGGMTGFSMGGQFGGGADAGLDAATRNYLLRFLR